MVVCARQQLAVIPPRRGVGVGPDACTRVLCLTHLRTHTHAVVHRVEASPVAVVYCTTPPLASSFLCDAASIVVKRGRRVSRRRCLVVSLCVFVVRVQWITSLNAAADAGLLQMKSPSPSPMLMKRQDSASDSGAATPAAPARLAVPSSAASAAAGSSDKGSDTPDQYRSAAAVAVSECNKLMRVRSRVPLFVCGRVHGECFGCGRSSYPAALLHPLRVVSVSVGTSLREACG